MRRYLAVLGRTEDLSFAELQTVLFREDDGFPSLEHLDHLVIIRHRHALDCSSLLERLGGTLKIAALTRSETTQSFVDRLVTVLKNESLGKTKLVFGVSLVKESGKVEGDKLLLSKLLKERLTRDGIASRYILSARGTELTSAQVKLHGLVELYVIWRNGSVEIARTLVVQDFQGFAARDYGRPYARPGQGMLPPKVARMMVNLAFRHTPSKKSVLLDPFCGTGTIAMEAMMLGIPTINSDLKTEQVEGTKRNLAWLARRAPQSEWLVHASDATKITAIVKRKVDAIVTEPYLGPRYITEQKLANIIKGLNKLYLGSLKEWRKILKTKSRVVMVLPEFRMGPLVKRADLVIDRCEKLGYTLVAGPYEYERPEAIVKRNIVVFERA